VSRQARRARTASQRLIGENAPARAKFPTWLPKLHGVWSGHELAGPAAV